MQNQDISNLFDRYIPFNSFDSSIWFPKTENKYTDLSSEAFEILLCFPKNHLFKNNYESNEARLSLLIVKEAQQTY